MNVVRTHEPALIALGAGLAKHANPRILVIQLGRLGDAIQTTPLLEAVQRANPRAQVEVLVFDCAMAALDGIRSVGVRVLREGSLPGRASNRIALSAAHRRWNWFRPSMNLDFLLTTASSIAPTRLWLRGSPNARQARRGWARRSPTTAKFFSSMRLMSTCARAATSGTKIGSTSLTFGAVPLIELRLRRNARGRSSPLPRMRRFSFLQ